MLRFLRYNTRHHFYWCLGGKPRWKGDEPTPMGRPKLNPISSVYGGGIKNISMHEPLWMFRLRQRLFAFAGRQRCGRRDDPFAWNRGDSPLPDTWDIGPDGNRTCSYCGSIHFDDLMKICRLVLEDERYAIEGTTKSYKVYVKQPEVMNASQGAIKFYKQHSPVEPTEEEQHLFREAVGVSNERHAAMMERWRTERQAISA